MNIWLPQIREDRPVRLAARSREPELLGSIWLYTREQDPNLGQRFLSSTAWPRRNMCRVAILGNESSGWASFYSADSGIDPPRRSGIDPKTRFLKSSEAELSSFPPVLLHGWDPRCLLEPLPAASHNHGLNTVISGETGGLIFPAFIPLSPQACKAERLW
jgi:hypothetical protein